MTGSNRASTAEYRSPRQIPAYDGEMRALIDAVDWSQTPLGPRLSWSAALQMIVDLSMAVLAKHTEDVPVAALYLFEEQHGSARLAAAAGVTSDVNVD